MWYKWAIHMVSGVRRFATGTTYSQMGNALDAAMWAAINTHKDTPITKIEIYPTK